MALELDYSAESDVPEKYRELYTEKDGKFVLSEINGMKTQQDVDNVKTALAKEREFKKAAENKLTLYDGIESDGLRDSLDELARLRITKGKVDDSKLEEMVEARTKLDREKYARDIEKLGSTNTELSDKNTNLVNGINKAKIKTDLRDAAGLLVNDTAMSDVEFHASIFEVSEDGNTLTRNGIDGVTPGQDPNTWITEALKNKPHWQKTTSGIGANGNNGGNASKSEGKQSYTDMFKEAGATFN